MTKIRPLMVVAYRNKKKYKRKVLAGLIAIVVAVLSVIWAELNWEQYSEVRRLPFLGNIEVEVGLAPTLYGVGLTLIVLIPIIYVLDKFFSDYTRPGIGVNRQGFYINLSLFKDLFIEWDQFDKIEKADGGGMLLHMKNPEKIIASQPMISRWLLEKTYVRNKMPIQVHYKIKNIGILEFIDKMVQRKDAIHSQNTNSNLVKVGKSDFARFKDWLRDQNAVNDFAQKVSDGTTVYFSDEFAAAYDLKIKGYGEKNNTIVVQLNLETRDSDDVNEKFLDLSTKAWNPMGWEVWYLDKELRWLIVANESGRKRYNSCDLIKSERITFEFKLEQIA